MTTSMNKQALVAYQQYKDLVTAWGREVNMEAYENGCQLIKWIEDQNIVSTVEQRQDVKATNWESLLSGFPTEAIQDEIQRRSKPSNYCAVCHTHGRDICRCEFYIEKDKIERNGGMMEIASDSPVCPGCGQYMAIVNEHGKWKCWCDCIIGSEIAIPYQSSREEVIRVQNEAILRYQGK